MLRSDRLKGQCHEIYNTFYKKKTLPGPNMNRQKRFRENFHFREDIREMTMTSRKTSHQRQILKASH